ncbi:uncharacterized [Tachysurus ichikawai]
MTGHNNCHPSTTSAPNSLRLLTDRLRPYLLALRQSRVSDSLPCLVRGPFLHSNASRLQQTCSHSTGATAAEVFHLIADESLFTSNSLSETDATAQT